MGRMIAVRVPSNIALIKYWGKRQADPIIPFTSSLSITLSDLITTTTFEEGPFQATLNGKLASLEDTNRMRAMLKHFPDDHVRITSHNHFPTAAGLASSASGFAALALGLNAYFKAGLSTQELASLARIGSGSACRSLTPDFTIWHTSGTIETLANPFQDLRMIVVIIQAEKKPISSRDAMKISVATSPYFQSWIKDSEHDLFAMQHAIQNVDFNALGSIMETNSDRLYHVMKTSLPVIDYRLPKTHTLLSTMIELRKRGLMGYATLDAGPNVKILTYERHVNDWIQALQQLGLNDHIVSQVGAGPDVAISN